MKQNNSSPTTQMTATMTDKPTKTVAARKAGDKMEAKSSNRPTHLTEASDSIPPSDKTVQNLHSPKWPGLLEVAVSPTHSSCRNTTMFRIAEQTVKTPHKIDTDFECLMYLVVSSWMVVDGEDSAMPGWDE